MSPKYVGRSTSSHSKFKERPIELAKIAKAARPCLRVGVVCFHERGDGRCRVSLARRSDKECGYT
jgi:hypothetical protein